MSKSCTCCGAVLGMGWAVPVEGVNLCGVCALPGEIVSMEQSRLAGRRHVVYVAPGGVVQSWQGGRLGRVVERHTTLRRPPRGFASRVDFFRVEDRLGNFWGGYGCGEGLMLVLKPERAREEVCG